MNAAARTTGATPILSLEEVELELALQIQNIADLGFAPAVEAALLPVNGQLLFDMPCNETMHCQRVAAIVAGEREQAQVLLVLLARDGLSVKVENAASSDHAFASFAMSNAAMLNELRGLLPPCDPATAASQHPST